MPHTAPFMAPPADIQADWIDYNGHLNMAYYNVLFDRGADRAFETFGLTENYVKEQGLSFFVAEVHVCYLRELHLGDKVQASFQLLGFDEKRLHVYHELLHSDGWVAATCETLYLHIDASGPKVAAIPSAMAEMIKAMYDSHNTLAWPDRAGRQIKITGNKKPAP